MTDKLQALYDGLKGDYNLGSIDEFRNNMNDEAKRRMFYDAVSSDYNLGDYDTFNSKLGYGEANAVDAATEANQQTIESITPEVQEERPFKADDTYLTDEDRQTVADTAKMSWKEAKKLGDQLAGIAGQRPTEESSQRAMDYLNANREDAMQQEEIKKLNQKRKTEAAQPIAEQLRDVAKEYKEQAKIFRQEDNDLERKYLELMTAAHNYATEQCGPMPGKLIKSDSGWGKAYMDYLESNDPEHIREKYNDTASRSKRNNTVSFLEHMANQTERRAKATIVQGSVSGVERTLGGAWYGLTQPGSWSLGMSDLWTAENVISLANKLKDGQELTDYEQAALDAYGTYQEAAAILHEYDTRGFKAGETTGEMVPFMVQMALNPGGSLGEKAAQKGVQKAVLKATEASSKEAAEAVATQAMKEYGTMATKDLLRNYGVDGMMARLPIAMRKVGGDLAASAVLANTLQIGSTVNDIAERKYGAPVYEDGHYTFDPEQEKSLAEAVYKAEMAGIIENFTEMMGEWRVLGIADKMNKFGSKKVGQMVRAMGDTDFAKGLGKVLRDAHWSGVIGETMEEEYGIILNSLLTGDNKLSDLWDLDQQIDIFLGVGLFGGVMGGAKMAAYPIEYASRKKNLEERTAWNREIVDDWDEIQDKIDSADDTTLAGIVKSAILRRDSDKESKAEQVKAEAIIQYVDALQGFRGITIARDMLPADADEKTMQAFWLQGYDGTDKQAVKAAYEHKRGQIELIDPYLLDVLDNEGINAQIRNEEGQLEDLFQGQFRMMAMDYLNAKAAYDGLLAGITDRAQSKAREAEVMVRANDNNGQQIQATTRTGDKVHIVSGEITMAGEVASLDNSSQSIIIRHEDGSKEMVSPLFIKSVDNIQDTEEVVQESMQRAAQETILQESQEAETPDVDSAMQAMADTELAKERGTEQATYQQGDEIALPDGTTGIINQGIGQTEDGKVEVIWNEPREGKKVEQFTADELYNLQHPAEAAPETAQDEQVLNTESAAMPSAEQQAYDEWTAKHGDNALNKLNQTRAYAEKELTKTQEEYAKVRKELDDLPDIEDAAISKKKGELEKKAAELLASIDNYTATLDRMNAIQSIYDAQSAQPAAEDVKAPIVQRAEEWARNTGVKANIITRVEDVANTVARQKIEAQIEAEKQGKPADRVKGWYDTKTKEVYFYLPNIEDVKDLDETYIHEVVAHRGLNELLGSENYATLCRQVWNQLMTEEQRQTFLGLVSHLNVSEEAKQLAAADEFIAYFAEQMQMNPTEEVKTTWQQLMQMLVDLLHRLTGTNITEQDLSDLLVDSLTLYKLRNQQNVQPKAENKMQPVKIEQKAKKRIKREEPTEFEMIQGAVEDIIDELDFATQVRYAVSKYRFLWKDTKGSKGLANSIIATKGGASEKDRRQYFVWTAGADKGGKTPEQIAHAILADMPDAIAEGHDVQEVLDIVLEAVQSAKSPSGLVRQVYEDLIAREDAADREYEEQQKDRFAREHGFASYEEFAIFEAGEDLQPLTEEEWNNLYNYLYDTTGEGSLEPGVQGMVQPAAGQGEDISRGGEMGLGEGSNGQGAGNERAEAQGGTTDVLPGAEKQEVVQPQRTIYHPSTLVRAYQSGDETQIAEAEKAMRDFIMSTPKEDKRKIEVTLQQAKDFIRKNKKDESQANMVRMNQFVEKCCKDRLKQIAKEPAEEKPAQKSSPMPSNIQGLEGYTEQEIQDIVTNYINEFKDYLPEDFKITGVRIVGSRANGTANEDSDLDVLVQYEGSISEDAFFNLLNGGIHEGDADTDIDPLDINQITVDINPIRPDKSGTIDEWLERNKDYKKEQEKLTNDQVEAIATVEGKTPAQVRTERQQDTLEDVSESIAQGREEQGNTRYLTEPVINDYLDIPAVQDYLRKFGNENTKPEDVLQQASGMAYVQYGMPLSILFAQAKDYDSSKQKVADIMSGKILYRETPQNTTLDQVLFRIDVNHNSPYLLKKADGAFIDPITGETLGFDNRFALTGEGNNVHGYGSYFSVNDLREYAGKENPMHLQRNIRYKGNWYKWDEAQDIFTAYDLIQQEGTVAKAIRKAEKFLNNAKEWGLGDEAVATWKRVVDFMNNTGLKKSDLKQEYRPDPGHHYDVTIPDNTGTNYLEEMITLRPSQRRRIADAVRKLEGEPAHSVKYVNYRNGWESLANMIERNQWAYQEIRDRLVQAFGGKLEAEKQVSELMSSIGFTGVHYNGRLDGECYVIFNPEDAEIVNHTMFRESKVTPEQDAEYMKAVEAGDMEKAQKMVADAFIAEYPNTKVVLANGEPQVVYHGTPSPAFTQFAKPGENLQGLIWLSEDEEYAISYAYDFRDEENKEYGEPNAPQKKGVYRLYASITNPLDLGNIEDVVGSDTWNQLAEKLDMTPEQLFDRIAWDGSKYEDSVKQQDAIYEITRMAKIVDLLKEKGYDGVTAEEGDNFTPTWGAVDSNQVKSAEPVTRDDNGNVIPLSQRFTESDDIRFRTANDKASLMGAHNLSEDKLKKVLKQGGLANPSMAIVDTNKGIHKGYGNISLIPYSSQLDASKTRGVATYSGDVYSPSYPGVTHKLTGKGEKKIDEMAKRLAKGDKTLEDYLHTRIFNHAEDNGTRLSTAYLLDKGIEPDIVYESGQHTHEEYERVKDLMDRWRKAEETADDKKVVLDILMEQEKDRYEALIEKAGSKDNAVKNFAKKRYEEAKERITDENGELYYSVFNQYLDGVRRSEQLRNERRIDLYRTEDNSLQKITQAGLTDDYWKWVENLFTDEEWPEMLFGGFTPAGYRRWLPNTLENASRLMNKQSDRNADDWNGWNATKSLLLKKMRTLADIRKMKDQLKSQEEYDEEIKKLSDGWTDIVSELSSMQRISDNQFMNMDYAENRLQEAITMSDPIGYLNKEYGYDIDKDSDFAKDLLQAIDNMKKAPAKYFETKFTRPVYLNEFKTAIVPSNLDEELRRGLERAGINVVDYKANDMDDYENKVREATEGDTDVRFRVANANQAIFVSNAQKAVENIKQDKATPDQWLAMIQKQGGIKAGEDKWLRLSQWLQEQKSKTMTKGEILEFIDKNKIKIEEQLYSENPSDARDLEEYYPGWFEAFYEDSYEGPGGESIEWRISDLEKAVELYNANNSIAVQIDIDENGEISNDEFDEILDWAQEAYRDTPMMERGINPTRLSYSTEGLDNKREIALWVPNIEPWNESDPIHFGDAGSGRAIAWIRFGDARGEVQRTLVDRHVEEFGEPIENANHNLVYHPKGKDSFSSKEYVVYGTIRTGEKKYVLMVNDSNEQIGPFDSLDEAKEALNIWYNTYPKYKTSSDRILVIDEIQSKRHQEGREKGYKRTSAYVPENDVEKSIKHYIEYCISQGDSFTTAIGYAYNQISDAPQESKGWTKELVDKVANAIKAEGIGDIPDAPFEKNWSELAMKRMLRLAAEEGYDRIAWTTGNQQSERYNIGGYLSSIKRRESNDINEMEFALNLNGANSQYITTDKNGNVVYSLVTEFRDRNLADIIGKELAEKALALKENEEMDTDDITISNSGMAIFYDKMLVNFMNKYGKQWGVKVENVDIPGISESNWENAGDGLTMHSVEVTPEMRRDVMEGQVMFRVANEKNKEVSTPEPELDEDIMFRVSNRDRETISKWLSKRTDLTEPERNKVLDYIDTLDDKKIQLATGWWFAKGSIRIPEDMPKVEQAVQVANVAKVDPMQYSSPMELINAHANIEIKEKPINPDDVETLHEYRELPDGIVVYDVDDTEESRQNMRRIIDTHFGKESSPWCLLQGDGEGGLTRQSKEYWDYYNSYPKQVAFKNGKLLAFSANRGPVRWWDRMDEPHVGIPVEGKIPNDELGRTGVMEYDPIDGEATVVGDMWKGNPDNGPFETYYDTGQLRRRSTRKDTFDVGPVEVWHKNGQKSAEFTNNELGNTEGEFKTWYPNGQLHTTGTMVNGRPVGVHETYFENGQLEMRTVYPNTWKGNEHPIEPRERFYPNGQIRSIEPYDENGIKNGTETEWFEDGQKEYEVKYVNNEPKSSIHWFQNGDVESKKYWDEDGLKTGVWEKYRWDWESKKAVPAERATYKNGIKDGIYEEYYPNGNIKTQINFKDAREEGLTETWNEDGKPFLRLVRKDNKLIGEEYYDYMTNEVAQLYSIRDGAGKEHDYVRRFPMDGYKPLTAEELATYPEWVKERAAEEDGIDIRFRETPSLFTPEEMAGNVAGSQQSINFAGNGESTNIQREGATATTERAGRGTAEVREATSVIMPLRALEPGETCHAERKLAEAGEFSFIGKDYLESIDDIAFIFKKLETKAVENAFLTFVKDGKATVLHVGMGAVSQSALDLTPIAAMMRNINPDKVYFIHNHPSGNLVSSKQDREIWKGLRSALGEKLAPGIIIDTTKGVYGQFGPEISMEKEYKEDSKGDVKIPVYRFDERVFDKDYDPAGDRLMNSRDIAAFVASQRLGERDKISVIVSDYNRNIVGNFFLPYTRLDSNTTINKVATDCAYYCGMTGGNVVYIYGNGIADRDTNLVSLAARKIKDFLYNQQIILNDIVGCYNEGNGSYYSYHDHGIMEPLAPYGAAEPIEGEEIRFREVTDPAQVKELEESKKGKGYRNVTLNADGTLGSPMAGKLGRKGAESVKTSPFELGKWEQSEENPDMADENGKVNLIKPQGRGSVGSVDYNPYIHIRPTTLNKQFTQAWARPELAYVETEYPESELNGEYKADKAKLPTGRHAWNGGELILSRYDKPMRIVPWSEVADEWEKEFKDSGVTFDIVPPALLPILKERGVKILQPKKAAGDAAREAYNDWKENGENASYRSMVDYGNDMLRQKAAIARSVNDNAELDDISKLLDNTKAGTAEYETYSDLYILAASGKSVREAKEAVINNAANATESVADRMTEEALTPVMTPLTDMAEVRYRISREPSRVRSTYNDGDITVYNPRNAADVQASVMRESYTHKDIRNVKGWDNVTEAAYRMSGGEIATKALRNGMDFDAATEEWMYENAERMVVPFERMLAQNGVGLLYRMTGDEIRMYLTKSGDLLDDADLFITKEELPVEQTVRFRTTPAPSQTRDQYDASQQALANKLYRAYIDYTKPLRDLQDIIAKDSGEPIEDFENAWEAENQRSSKSKAEIEKFELDHYEKIRDAVRALEEATGMKYDDILRYLIAKHGLERNVVLAQRDAEADYKKYQQENPGGAMTINDFLQKRRERDYSGLTDLSGEKKVAAAEAYAQDLVDSVERSAQQETDDLWNAIADAVAAIQKKRYQSGLISRDQLQHEKDMFDHYIPLRGFAETIAEDVYDYYEDSTRNRPQRDRKAQGRTSLADDPLATLGAMAASAIQAGNKNLVKQRFLNMVENHKNDIATVKDVWVVNHGTATTPVWEPEYPDIHEGMDADAIRNEIDSYTQRMEQLKAQGLAKKATNKLNIKWRTLGQQAQQHIITVRRNGQEQMIIINGNPQVARTVNGINNPDANLSNFMRGVRAVQRFMAANFTTRNPAFVVSNLCRDLGFATMAIAAKENEPYRHQFMKNVMGVSAKTVRMGVLIKKWQRNMLDMNNEVERYFKEFMENGGETGYTAENTVDAFRKKMEKGLKERSKAAKAGDALLDFFELCNRSVEDFTRFTTYMTSRQMGRTVQRSVADAKNITVNFNRKGSGEMGQKYIASAYLFLNAGIQSLQNVAKISGINLGIDENGKFGLSINGKKLAKASATLFGSQIALGMIVPMLNEFMMGLMGGDDDDDVMIDENGVVISTNPYRKLTEYERRNNLCFWVGGNRFVKIPLAIELRAFYGLGETLYGYMAGIPNPNPGADIVGQITDLLPVNFVENGGLVPDAVAPLWESYITNRNYQGIPLYNDSEFLENNPEASKAYSNTGDLYMALSRWINELGGGDDIHKSKLDTKLTNPAIMQHIVEGYLGGLLTTSRQTAKLIGQPVKKFILGKDVESIPAREWPVVNRLYINTDKRNDDRYVKDRYYYYRDKAEQIRHDERGYLNNIDDEHYARKYEDLVTSPEYLEYITFDALNKNVKQAHQDVKEYGDEFKIFEVDAMRELVNALDEETKSKISPEQWGKNLKGGGKNKGE